MSAIQAWINAAHDRPTTRHNARGETWLVPALTDHTDVRKERRCISCDQFYRPEEAGDSNECNGCQEKWPDYIADERYHAEVEEALCSTRH